MVAFAIQASAPPFPLFVIAYSINGFGASFGDAQANGYVASYKDNAAAKMGFLHAAYGEDTFTLRPRRSPLLGRSGFGALTAPLAATHFARLHRWSFHYLVSFGVATLNTVVLVCVFKLKSQDGTTFLLDMTSELTHWNGSECLAQIGQLTEEKESVNGSKYKEMFKLKALHLLALFILVYVGVEVTIGGMKLAHSGFLVITHRIAGWIVTYVIQVRHGGPSSGYISAGFFGGKQIMMMKSPKTQ